MSLVRFGIDSKAGLCTHTSGYVRMLNIGGNRVKTELQYKLLDTCTLFSLIRCFCIITVMILREMCP